MRPYCNQLGRFFVKAKTHKANSINDMKIENLKLRPIIDQVNTCHYNAVQVLAEYLKPLAENNFTLKNTQLFPQILNNMPSLMPDEEDVSYDVKSLFSRVSSSIFVIKYIGKRKFVHCAEKTFLSNCSKKSRLRAYFQPMVVFTNRLME